MRRRYRVGSGAQDGGHGRTIKTSAGPAHGLEEPLSVEERGK
jgi:hypothetical protein